MRSIERENAASAACRHHTLLRDVSARRVNGRRGQTMWLAADEPV